MDFISGSFHFHFRSVSVRLTSLMAQLLMETALRPLTFRPRAV